MNYGSSDLQWSPCGDGYRRATVHLDRGDSAWNPASTKRLIYGPATVEYLDCPSGSIEATVKDREVSA